MRETSFGKMDIILKLGKRPIVEYLLFEKEGRAHKHKEYESFYVLSGSGRVVSGEQTYNVKKGSMVTIPPETPHWMIPNPGQVLEGFLWYHDGEIQRETDIYENEKLEEL